MYENKQTEFVKMFMNELNEEMKHQGYTHTSFAKSTGVSRQTITRLITGENMPSLMMIEKLSNHLGMKPVLCLMEND